MNEETQVVLYSKQDNGLTASIVWCPDEQEVLVVEETGEAKYTSHCISLTEACSVFSSIMGEV